MNVDPTSRAQVLLLGAFLDLDDGPGVDGLAGDEAGQTGDDELGVGADDVGEVFLVRIEVSGGRYTVTQKASAARPFIRN